MGTNEARLFTAIERGELPAVEAALNAGASLDARNNSGQTPLHLAAINGNVAIVQALLDRGANPNAGLKGGVNRNFDGCTPLTEAVRAGQTAVLRPLLQRGADPFAPSVKGSTPVGFAEMRGKRFASSLFKAIAQTPAALKLTIHQAAHIGLIDRLRSMLDEGIDVNRRDAGGETPLHHAVRGQQAGAVRLLIERGADVNARDVHGFYPLMRVFDTTQVARLLLEAGADPNADVAQGLTVFLYLVGSRRTEMVEMLLDFGANLTARSADGRGVMDYTKNATPRVRALIKERMGIESTPAEAAVDAVRAELKRLPSLSADERFKAVAAWLETLFTRAPAPWRKRKGVLYFHNVSIIKCLAPHYGEAVASSPTDQDQFNRLLTRLQEEILSDGCTLVYVSASPDDYGRLPLILLPTREKYAALLATGTNGINHGHTNEAVISWLISIERTNPFVIAGCGLDFVDGRFTAALTNAEVVAEQMIDFCPDLASQSGDELSQLPRERQIAEVAKDLQATRAFNLWWD